jgi:chemotaxis protein methyltransferase CheR
MSTLDRPLRPEAGTAAARPRTAATDDYVGFCEAFRTLTRIDLGQYKRGQMERRIRTFAQRGGFTDLIAYSRTLQADPVELERFLDRVTINVSQLWRNPQQWSLLARDVIPELAAGGRIRAWSAGSSYGAEAFTLAAVCKDVAPTARVDILGTDIDKRMVERARLGWFSVDDARDAPNADLQRWFTSSRDGWQAKPELLKSVRFEAGDLLRVAPAAGSYDLILCRNTVIYFSEDVRDALHARLAEALRPGGYLLVGSTERVSNVAACSLESCLPFTYRKVA